MHRHTRFFNILPPNYRLKMIVIRKSLLFTCCSLFVYSFVFSQDSISLQQSLQPNPYAPAPLITVKGELFRTFPSDNFLDAVTGLFPGTFLHRQGANNFLFVVNGLLLTDINSISLHDIEEVSFSINSLNGNLYPFSKAGIFYITTRKYRGEKIQLSFNAQYDVSWQKNNKSTSLTNTVNTQQTTTQPGHWLSNHFSLVTGGKNWELYTAVQLNETSTPKAVVKATSVYPGIRTNDSTITNGIQNGITIRSFAQFLYRFSSALKAGVTGSYFNGYTKSDTTLQEYLYPNLAGNRTTGIKSSLPYSTVAGFIDWTPLHHLSNRITAEYAVDKLDNNAKDEQIGFSFTDPNLTSITTADMLAHNKLFLLRDELKYDFITTSAFHMGVKAIFSYLNHHLDYKNNVLRSQNGIPAQFQTQTFGGWEKVSALNPNLYFSYKNLVSGYAGYALRLNKGADMFTGKSKTNPYAGLVFDVKKLVPGVNKLDRLDLSVDYASLLKNNLDSYWLPGIDNASETRPSFLTGSYYAPSTTGTSKLSLQKTNLIAIQVNAGFLNDRLLAGAVYSRKKTDSLYVVNFYYTYYVNISETQQSFAVYVAGKLINRPLMTWTVSGNIQYFPQAAYENGHTPVTSIQSLKDQWQAGLQNSITWNNWYARINGLLALNKKTVNTWLLNYAQIGYNFKNARHLLLQRTSIFLQVRNALVSSASKNYYGYYSYGGAGLNLEL